MVRAGALVVALLCGCGSTGTGAPRADGGPVADGGGAAIDGGPASDGGASADGGTPLPYRILPGDGLDVVGLGGATARLRVGQTRAQVRPLVGDGADSPYLAGTLDREYPDGYVLFFANTDQSTTGGGSPQPTFTDGDKLRYLAAGEGFPGKTAGGTGPGSLRAAWLAELGTPDLTQTNLDVAGQSRDIYFGRGLVVAYDAGERAVSYTVSRGARKPDVRIELATRRLGTIQAGGSGGSAAAAIVSEWGEPDLVEDYTAVIYPGRNYGYAALGLLFVTQASLGGSDYRVTGIVFFDPYYGRADVGDLGVRSTKAELDTYLTAGGCAAQTTTLAGQQWTVYRYVAGRCDARIGVVFGPENRARSLFLNIP
jgi:hypothetical protein